jgi:hypothetical protein
MAKALLGISILILLCAAGLGFATKSKVEQKVRDLAKTKTDLLTTEGKLKKTSNELETANTNLTAANTTIEDQKTKITAAETAAAAAKAEAEKAAADAKEKDALLLAANEKIKKMETPDPNAAPTENPAMAALQKQVEDATNQAKEAKVAAEQYQARQKAAEEKVAGLEQTIEHYRNPIRQAGLTGNVLHVNQGWNFVVIDIGDKQGVTVNTPLIVMRGNQRVATLKVSSVEPRQAIADVVPGSMARGQMVQVGDRVVFAGTRGQPTAPPPAPTGAEAPATAGGATPPLPR